MYARLGISTKQPNGFVINWAEWQTFLFIILNDMEPIIERLKKYLDMENISALQFAKHTGIPQDRVYGWLRRKGNPKYADQVTIENFMQLGQTPKLDEPQPDKKNPASSDAGDEVNQKYVALLERQESRAIEIGVAAAKAAVMELSTNYATKKDLSKVQSSLDEMNKVLTGTRGIVWGIQRFAVEQLAELKNISEDAAADLLDNAIKGFETVEKKSRKVGAGK